MSDEKQSDATGRATGSSLLQNERVRRITIYAAVLLAVFLLGLVPMWLTARTRASELDAARAALRVSTLQNTLANAAIDARRGDYEPARLSASEFFSNLRAEVDRGRDSAFNQTQQNSLRSMFDSRDETITLLARSDSASTDRLLDLYNTYRGALVEEAPVPLK